MSWDDYIDKSIVQMEDASGLAHCDKACIIDMNSSNWTTCSNPNLVKLQGSEPQVLQVS